MTKKIIIAAIAAVLSCSALFAANPESAASAGKTSLLNGRTSKAKPYTNLLDKLPSGGYVGFAGVEIAAPGSFGDGGFGLGVTTSHGFMLRPTVFLGGGVGYIHNFQHDEATIPIFAEGRLYFASQFMRRIYPHIGLRLGGQLSTHGGGGFYSQLACGFRVPLTEKLALNVEVGPQYASGYQRHQKADQLIFGGPWEPAKAKFAFFGRIAFEF